jgi:hypothetical protein
MHELMTVPGAGPLAFTAALLVRPICKVAIRHKKKAEHWFGF